MENPLALQENTTPYISYGTFCTENGIIPKHPLDSKIQINVQAMNSTYSETETLLNVTEEEILKNGICEQNFREEQMFPSGPTRNVSRDLEKEILIHNNNQVCLKSNLNLTVKGEENGVSDLDSSTGVGKASSGYCTDTSEKEEVAADVNIAHKFTMPLCFDNSSPTSLSAVNEAQAAESSTANEVKSSESSTIASPRNIRTSLRPRPKRYSMEVAPNLLPFHVIGTDEVTPPMCSENSSPPTLTAAVSFTNPRSRRARSRHARSGSYSRRRRSKRSSTQVPVPQQSPLPLDVEQPAEDLLPFDMEKLLHCDYTPETSEEIYLKTLTQQLDSSFKTAVVLVRRLENTDPSVWRKYLSK